MTLKEKTSHPKKTYHGVGKAKDRVVWARDIFPGEFMEPCGSNALGVKKAQDGWEDGRDTNSIESKKGHVMPHARDKINDK